MLELLGVDVYRDRSWVLKKISLQVAPGDLVTLIGSAGAGKTTLLMTISGILPAGSGSIRYQQADITNQSPSEIVYRGISQVPEGRQLFPRLSVLDNLRLGAYIYSNRKFKFEVEERLDWVYQMFPVLQRKAEKRAGDLSTIEQQMASMARSLMARPTLLLLDEPCRDLTPPDFREIYDGIRLVNERGISVLLAEPQGRLAFSCARYGYHLENGSIVREGPVQEFLQDKKGRVY
jgi:branched-chain amino acid transport system ATP-binding protein